MAGIQCKPAYYDNPNKDGNNNNYPEGSSREFINNVSPHKRHSWKLIIMKHTKISETIRVSTKF